jgi:hypothetical protein
LGAFILGGFINGSYDGTGDIGDEGTGVKFSETNLPKSKYENVYWAIGNYNCESCGRSLAGINSDNKYSFTLGSIYDPIGDAGWLYTASTMTNYDAYSIDVKLDDGKSYTGYVMGANANGLCADGASGDPLDYYEIAYISANSFSETGNCNPTFLYK